METLKSKLAAFWHWFADVRSALETDINNGQREAAANTVGNRLAQCGLPVLCEVGGENGVYSIVLNPCSDKTDQFIARYWRACAPEIPNWTFSPYRKPRVGEIPELAHALGKDFALEGLRFWVTVDEENQRYAVTVTTPLFSERDSDEDISFVKLLFYIILGEGAGEVYIGQIHTQAHPPKQADYADLDAGQLVAIVAETPNVRAWPLAEDPTAVCYGFGKEGEDQDDLRQDIVVGLTRHPQLISYPFAVSDALRLRGGAFCYLYYAVDAANPQRNSQELVRRFFQVEELLMHFRIGYTVGHATGTDFNYIDMMIFDEPVFRSLFHDAEKILGVPVSIGAFSRDAGKIQ